MSIETLRDLSQYSQWAGSLIITSICLYQYRDRPSSIRLVGYYGLISCCFQLFQQASISFFGNRGLNAIGDGYVLAEAIILSLVFLREIHDKRISRIIIWGTCGYIMYYGLVFLFSENNVYSLIRTGRDTLLIAYAIGYFYYMLKLEMDILNFPMFWISAAILFFFSGTFVLSLMVDYIAQLLKDNFDLFWAFRNFFRFAFCLVLAYAGWLDLQLIKANRSSGTAGGKQ
jgi:hypothetical protein